MVFTEWKKCSAAALVGTVLLLSGCDNLSDVGGSATEEVGTAVQSVQQPVEAMEPVKEDEALEQQAQEEITEPFVEGLQALPDGVMFRAVGNEPFWRVDVVRDGAHMVYYTSENPDGMILPIDEQEAHAKGISFKGEQAGQTYELVVSAGVCADGMSGQQFDQKAVFALNDEVMRGCASGGVVPNGR